MYTARVSQTDPHAFASLRAVLRDARYANTDLYLHVEPGRYAEPYALQITSRVMIVPVGGPGTVEISVAADSVFVVKGDRGVLELYGIHVRGGTDTSDSPTVLAEQGSRFKAVDSVFTSGTEVEVNGDGTEVVNCRFDGCDLYWKRGTGGFVRDAVFRGAGLTFWRAVNPTVSSVRFSDYDQGSLTIADSSVTVTDCVMTGFGKAKGGSLIVKDGSDARFHNLSITGSPDYSVLAVGEGTRVAFNGFSLTAWTNEKSGIAIGLGAEVSFAASRIDAVGAASTAVTVSERGTVTVEDLVVENTGAQAFFVKESRLSGRGLVCRRLGSYAIAALRSRIELADVEFTAMLPGAENDASGFYLSDSRLDADGARASDLTGAVILTSDDSQATLTSVSAERVWKPVMALGISTVRVHGARVTESGAAAFSTNDRGSLTVVDALVSGTGDTAVWSRGGSLNLTSVTVSGTAGAGAAVEEGAELTLEDTVVRDGHGVGVSVRGPKSQVKLLRSRITGNAGAGLQTHPETVVETQDTVIRDNEGGDRAHLDVETE
ncbi:right-handed parallel beta-helix repeat-containing protein [Nocardiopsis exhalans]|uniref:Right-handed parallel beta-helix repeat-containing protein n=1 Tax=Nocardiopsis exhalans TaxID=163604 RepID=A0ABY5D959_9ACTN|nr:right-handed parallel beta-helix repeat-containing protein [Nocardiopsis exhalans]USY20896.1 right-handed parallel beta-helix repeat-containing protein [Nocardiopsis exhalans]